MRHVNRDGFSFLELLIVIAIINVLAAIVITAYIGIQDKTRRAVIVRTASSSESEIRLWLQASVSSEPNLRTVDTNFDGRVDVLDKTNIVLYNDGVAFSYTTGRNAQGETSPFFPALEMWNSILPFQNGKINLIQLTGSQLSLVAKGKTGITLYETIINVD